MSADDGMEARTDGGTYWRVEFYHERRSMVARYAVVASTPAEAATAGRAELLAEYPRTPAPRSVGLFERAQHVGGLAPSGWVLYRIGKG